MYEVVNKKSGYVSCMGTLEACLCYCRIITARNVYIRNYYTKEIYNA